jgi:hypothetical protein
MYESVFPLEPMIAHGRDGVGAQAVLRSEMHILQVMPTDDSGNTWVWLSCAGVVDLLGAATALLGCTHRDVRGERGSQ